MASERMAAVAPGRGIAPGYGWALLETSIVFMVLAAPQISPVFRDLIVLGPLAIIVIYLLWAPVAAFRDAAFDLPSKLRAALFSLGQLVSAVMVAGNVTALVLIVWMRVAYHPEVLSPGGSGLGIPFILGSLAPLAVGGILVSIALFVPSATFLRRDDESVSDSLNRFIADRMRPLLPAAAATLLLGFGIASVLNSATSAIALPNLLESANPGRDVDVWFLVAQFPGLPAALVASAVLLAVFRRAQPAALASLRGARRDAGSRPPSILVALGSVASVGSIGVFFGWFLYIIHFGMVAALGPVAMIVSWQEVAGATSDWVVVQSEAGRSPDEIAAELRAHGSWTPAESDSSLAALFPELGESLKESSMTGNCSITLDAGVADNAPLRDQEWIRDFEAEHKTLPDVSYCIRLACPSPVTWHDHPVVILDSSHPSRNLNWTYLLYMDLFGNGRAFEPGGYCTADGRLAAEFQG